VYIESTNIAVYSSFVKITTSGIHHPNICTWSVVWATLLYTNSIYGSSVLFRSLHY